ncbi:c-type cytochrome [Aquabacter cavernae]|uniref:c-type cytochrome n=1 Tax=Aquabacter cavernae TaxID=2496029 RepID=UPI000F8F31BE|nr:cytochrome c [Aquabacter cavernae]
MRAVLLAGLLVPFVAGVALAQSDVIKERKALMGALGDQTKAGAAIMKGDQPYDPAKAAAIFKAYTDASTFNTLFPAGSNTGDTKAAPAIWSDRAGFDAEMAKFNTAVQQGLPNIGTEAGFKSAFQAVAATCRTCHSTYQAR